MLSWPISRAVVPGVSVVLFGFQVFGMNFMAIDGMNMVLITKNT